MKLRLALFVIVFLLLVFGFFNLTNKKTPQTYAKELFNECKNKIKESCYSGKLALIVKHNDLSFAKTVLTELLKTDNSLNGCHFFAHVLAYEEVNKKTANWKDIFNQVAVDECTGGFLMGALEGYKKNNPDFILNEKSIEKTCLDISRKTKNINSEATCIHTLGHLLLVDKKGNVNEAIRMCDRVNQSRYECYSGVFMENEFKRNLEAHQIGKSSVWNEKLMAEYKKLCAEYSGDPAKACWREISHLFAHSAKNFPPEVYKLCATAPDQEKRDECYIHAVGVMVISDGFAEKNNSLLCKPFAAEKVKQERCVNMLKNTQANSSI